MLNVGFYSCLGDTGSISTKMAAAYVKEKDICPDIVWGGRSGCKAPCSTDASQ